MTIIDCLNKLHERYQNYLDTDIYEGNKIKSIFINEDLCECLENIVSAYAEDLYLQENEIYSLQAYEELIFTQLEDSCVCYLLDFILKNNSKDFLKMLDKKEFNFILCSAIFESLDNIKKDIYIIYEELSTLQDLTDYFIEDIQDILKN